MINENDIVDIEKNIVVCVHIFYTELFDELCSYISNVKYVFPKNKVIFTITHESNFYEKIHDKYPHEIILKVENKGVDIGAFIECIKYMRQNKIPCDYILKMHSKLHHNSDFGPNWRQSLLEPIANIHNLVILKHYFKTLKNIGYVSAQRCILCKNRDTYYSMGIVKRIDEITNLFPHLEKKWTEFNAGTMFWINNTVLEKYLTDELINYIVPKLCYGKPPSDFNNDNPNIEYLCERMFTGIFCYNSINIFVTEYKSSDKGLDSNKSYYYQPETFSFHTPRILDKFTGSV